MFAYTHTKLSRGSSSHSHNHLSRGSSHSHNSGCSSSESSSSRIVKQKSEPSVYTVDEELTTGEKKQLCHKVGNINFLVVLTPEGVEKVDALHKLGAGIQQVPFFDDYFTRLLAWEEVYVNRIGQLPSRHQLLEAFGTCDKFEVVKQIVLNGKYAQ